MPIHDFVTCNQNRLELLNGIQARPRTTNAFQIGQRLPSRTCPYYVPSDIGRQVSEFLGKRISRLIIASPGGYSCPPKPLHHASEVIANQPVFVCEINAGGNANIVPEFLEVYIIG